jgi:hypothetical protein
MQMDKDEEKRTPAELLAKVHEGFIKAMGQLKRRGMIDEQTLSVLTPVFDYVNNKVKDHDCPAAAAVLMQAGKSLSEISAAIALFEDHIIDDHKDDKPETKPADVIVEKKDNVIHVDLTKGNTRKN